MTPTAVLLGYALLMSTAGSGVLVRARWPHRSPRLGVATWQAASFSVLAAVGLAGLVLVLPSSPLSAVVARAVRACTAALDTAYAAPGRRHRDAGRRRSGRCGDARCSMLLGHDLWTARRERHRHRRTLQLLARHHPELDALLLDHETVAAYCLPGRGGRVVFTTAALAALARRERQAVAAHERAHLRQRHHLVLAAACALRRGLPGVPLLRTAQSEIAVLVEMVADDASARRCDRRLVAAALHALQAPNRATSCPSAVG